jgi:thymidylate synthase (FAD)
VKLISPKWTLVRPENTSAGIDLLRFIENMARISHRSEEKQTLDSWERFLHAVVLEHGDWSVVEHATATVLFRINRGVTHELVRHRLFSFTQESTRFVNGRKSYPNGLEFIMPADVVPDSDAECDMRRSFTAAEEIYLRLLDQKVRPQEARAVLPNSLAATISVTGNLRNWRHFLLMRTTKETHPDFRQVTIPLLEEFKKRVPLFYDDIEPLAKQNESTRKMR